VNSKFIESKNAEALAKRIISPGDRIGCVRCLGRKIVFTFNHWDGHWMVSKTGICDFSPVNIYSINGTKISLI
jgi:hypothetical protein